MQLYIFSKKNLKLKQVSKIIGNPQINIDEETNNKSEFVIQKSKDFEYKTPIYKIKKEKGKNIVFYDGIGKKIKSLKAFGESIQKNTPSIAIPSDVISVDKIDYKLVGKNQFKLTSPVKNTVFNGVEITLFDDGKIRLNGTSTVDMYPDLNWGINLNTSRAFINKYFFNNTLNNITLSTKNVSGTATKIQITASFNGNENIEIKYYLNEKDSITLNKNVVSLNRVFMYIPKSAIFNNFEFYVQIEDGLNKTEYEQYNEYNQIINFPENVELRKLQNEVQDYIDENGIIHKNTVKINLGKENWNVFQSAGNSDRYYCYCTDYDNVIKLYTKANSYNYCNIAKSIDLMYTQTVVNDDSFCIGYAGSSRIRLMLKKTDIDSQTGTNLKEKLNNLLLSKNAYFIAETTQETTISLSEQEKENIKNINTFSGTNIINSNAEIEIEYISSEIEKYDINKENIKKGDILYLNGAYKEFYFIVNEVSSQKDEDLITISATDISNIFDRKIIEKNIIDMTEKSIEQFIGETINREFVTNDDLISIPYIDISIKTQTKTIESTNSENMIYNFHTFLINCRQNKNIFTKIYILQDSERGNRLQIDIQYKELEEVLIDTTVTEVANYNKIYEVDPVTKVTVFCRDDNSEYNLYLKADNTTTTDTNDTLRIAGRIEVISVDEAINAPNEALNVIKGNRYKHLVEFDIKKSSKLVDTNKLEIGTPIKIKTEDDIYLSYISAILLTNNEYIKYKSGQLRVDLIDKLKQQNKSKILGNKLDITGGTINGNVNINGNITQNNLKIKTEDKLLYDNSTGTIEDITLNDDINNYKYIDIYFGENNEDCYLQSVLLPNKLTNLSLLKSDSTGLYIKSKNITLNTKQIKVNYNSVVDIYSNGSIAYGSSNIVKIKRVIGKNIL